MPRKTFFALKTRDCAVGLLTVCGNPDNSTKKAYAGYLEKWIDQRWGEYRLLDVRAVEGESWLKSLNRAPGTRSKIRNVMNLLFNHGRRHELCDHNPIQWVRQSANMLWADRAGDRRF